MYVTVCKNMITRQVVMDWMTTRGERTKYRFHVMILPYNKIQYKGREYYNSGSKGLPRVCGRVSLVHKEAFCGKIFRRGTRSQHDMAV